MGLTAARTLQQSRTDAVALLEALSKEHAAEIDAELEVSMDAARTLAQVFEGYETLDLGRAARRLQQDAQSDRGKEPELPGSLHGLGTQRPGRAGRGVAGAPGHDGTGRFIPYWSRFGGPVELSPLVDYDKEGAGDYYILPAAHRARNR
ncbi:MAG: hypothetical protein M0C28_41475 [Candidatus Moduliflexus flocculans]|nr:hypothetical protein [Candidatus Moduliflexus flocculans]